jgi:hypothetical protein
VETSALDIALGAELARVWVATERDRPSATQRAVSVAMDLARNGAR